MLDYNQKAIDPFGKGGRHEDPDKFCLSQSYFDITKRTIRNMSNIILPFKQI